MVESIEKIKVSEVTAPFPLPFEPKAAAYDQSGSSLRVAEAAAEKYTPSKPVLQPPGNPIWQTINQLANRTEPVYDRWLAQRETQIDQKMNDLIKLNQEFSTKLEESLEASKEVTFWGILEDVAGTLSGAVSFLVGASAFTAGSTAVGGALIASGALSIGNLAFKHGEIWDWTADQVAGDNKELHTLIASTLPSAIGLTAAALGVYGAFGAWKYAAHSGMSAATSLLQSTTAITTGLVNYKSGISNGQMRWKSSEISALQSNADLSKLAIEEFVEDVKDFHKHQTELDTTIGKILDQTNQAIQIIQQPV